MIFVALFFSGVHAKAQFYVPVLPPPPQPVALLFGEHWREVAFPSETGLQYHWGGSVVHVDPEGVHWVIGENETKRSALRFVEPFDAFGRRVPKSVGDFPGAEKHSSQRHYNPDGSWYGKSKAHVGNRTWFPTWVLDGRSTALIWVEELKPKTAPNVPTTPLTPTPDPVFESKKDSRNYPAVGGVF